MSLIKTKPAKPAKDSVYQTDDGAALLLDPKDPKYKKPKAKKIDVLDDLFKDEQGAEFDDLKPKQKKDKQPTDYGKLRPVIGWLLIPYIIAYWVYRIIVLPVLRALAYCGNKLFDVVFKDSKGDTKQ